MASGLREKLVDPTLGYNPLLGTRMQAMLPLCHASNTCLITNMGAANPLAAGTLVANIAVGLGLQGLRIVVITGDDVTDLLTDSTHLAEPDCSLKDFKHSVVGANAYIVSMPENGNLRYLIGAEQTSVSTGQPLASVSTQLASSLTSPADIAALGDLSEQDVAALLGRVTVETVIASPCNCSLYFPAPRLDGFAYKQQELVHLLPQDQPLNIKASVPFERMDKLERVRAVEMRVLGSDDTFGAVCDTVGADDSVDAVLVLLTMVVGDNGRKLARDLVRTAQALDKLPALPEWIEPGMLTREKWPTWADALHSLRDLPNVIDIRNTGLVGAVHLASRPDAPGVRGYEVFDGCFWEGAMVRCSGDIIAMSPPLTVEKAELDRLVDTLATVIRRTA